MPYKLRRIVGRGDLHFITFTCYQRRQFLASVKSKNIVAQILGKVRRAGGAENDVSCGSHIEAGE